jgi:hypothetical protein
VVLSPEQPALWEETNMQTSTRRTLAAGLIALTLVGGGSGAAHASDDDGRAVRTSGSCSGASNWELKAKPDDGRIEIELEVDTHRVGRRWAVRIGDNGHRVFTGHRVTRAPSASWTVEKKIRNRAGADRIRAVARNPRTGERCVARLVFRG